MHHSKSVLKGIPKLQCARPTSRKFLLAVAFTTVTSTFLGCGHPGSVASKSQAEAFDIRLVKGVRWTLDTLRYDRSLPGYHLTGGIATIELRLKPDMHIDELVLDITTSPGMPPHLDGFAIAWADSQMKVAPFSESDFCDLLVKDVQGQWRGISRRRTEDYVHFQSTDSSVLVYLMPLSLRLMSDPCTVTWIDWYRK